MKNEEKLKSNKAKQKKPELVEFKNWQLKVSSEGFEERVKIIREKYGIPNGGFKDKREYFSWRRKLSNKRVHESGLSKGNPVETYEETELDLIKDTVFLRETKASKIKTAKKTKPVRVTEYTLFERKLKKFLFDFGLPSYWHVFAEAYVTRDKTPQSTSSLFGGRLDKVPTVKLVIREFNNGETEQTVRLEFGPNTGIENVKGIWKDKVERVQKLLLGYEKYSRKKPQLEQHLRLANGRALLKFIRFVSKKTEYAEKFIAEYGLKYPEDPSLVEDTATKAVKRLRKELKGPKRTV